MYELVFLLSYKKKMLCAVLLKDLAVWARTRSCGLLKEMKRIAREIFWGGRIDLWLWFLLFLVFRAVFSRFIRFWDH
jgi:hypothetical protein